MAVAEQLWVVGAVGAHILGWSRRAGLNTDEALREAGIDAQLFQDARKRVPVTSMIALWRALARQSNDPAFALRSGAAAAVAVLPIVGPLMATARDLKEAFGHLVRHASLGSNSTQAALTETSEGLLVRYTWDSSLDWPHHIPESVAAHWATFAEQLVGHSLPVASIGFPFPKPAHHQAHTEFFGCPVRYGLDSLEVRWAAEHADAEFWSFDPITGQALAELAVQQQRVAGNEVAARLREILRTTPRPVAQSILELSRACGMSPRTLQRRLVDEGTSYRAVLDECLRERAVSSLGNRAISIEDVASQLGYSTRSAFHRAFVRWTEQTPASWRTIGDVH